MSRFEIAFSGQIRPGADLEQVKANLARLFQADAQRIALLFSGRRMVIKNNLDPAAAEKYRMTLERAGAVVDVLDMDLPIENIELAPAPAEAPAPSVPAASAPGTVSAGSGRLHVAPRDEYMAAFANVDAPDFGLAPVGVDLQDQPLDPVAPAVDLSQFSLAPVGSDMGQAKPEPAAPPPDTSHLKVL